MHQTGSLDQVAKPVTAQRTLCEGKDVADMCCELRVLEQAVGETISAVEADDADVGEGFRTLFTGLSSHERRADAISESRGGIRDAGLPPRV